MTPGTPNSDDSSTPSAGVAPANFDHPALADAKAVVYDLDGTLVDLAVDWNAVAEDVLGVYADHAVKPPGDGLWELLGAAPEYGIGDAVEAAIARHEHAGARDSRWLPLADGLAEADPDRTAVCSLNCEEACRIALETHGVADRIGPVVGRDSVATYKPDPEPLLAAIEDLGVSPADAIFVGDSERDAVTAERAGVPFVWVHELVDE
ncbi:HAD hydrolase-like protein [Halorubrum gandharaense]